MYQNEVLIGPDAHAICKRIVKHPAQSGLGSGDEAVAYIREFYGHWGAVGQIHR